MEPRQKDVRRCETDKPRRFRIDKLEERIAPSASCDVFNHLLDEVLPPSNPGREGVARAISSTPC